MITIRELRLSSPLSVGLRALRVQEARLRVSNEVTVWKFVISAVPFQFDG